MTALDIPVEGNEWRRLTPEDIGVVFYDEYYCYYGRVVHVGQNFAVDPFSTGNTPPKWLVRAESGQLSRLRDCLTRVAAPVVKNDDDPLPYTERWYTIDIGEPYTTAEMDVADGELEETVTRWVHFIRRGNQQVLRISKQLGKIYE